jgi:hypothetical protein
MEGERFLYNRNLAIAYAGTRRLLSPICANFEGKHWRDARPYYLECRRPKLRWIGLWHCLADRHVHRAADCARESDCMGATKDADLDETVSAVVTILHTRSIAEQWATLTRGGPGLKLS